MCPTSASTLQCIVLIIILGSLEAFTTTNTCTKTSRGTSNLSAIANPLKRRSRTNIIHVESVQEYKEQVVNEKECISVVRFYSQYCKSCQASEPHFYKLASEFSNKDTPIKVNFVEVPLNKNTRYNFLCIYDVLKLLFMFVQYDICSLWLLYNKYPTRGIGGAILAMDTHLSSRCRIGRRTGGI